MINRFMNMTKVLNLSQKKILLLMAIFRKNLFCYLTLLKKYQKRNKNLSLENQKKLENQTQKPMYSPLKKVWK